MALSYHKFSVLPLILLLSLSLVTTHGVQDPICADAVFYSSSAITNNSATCGRVPSHACANISEAASLVPDGGCLVLLTDVPPSFSSSVFVFNRNISIVASDSVRWYDGEASPAIVVIGGSLQLRNINFLSSGLVSAVL